MRILIVTPAPRDALHGNRVTANRYRKLLAGLGHDVDVAAEFISEPCDLLVALHARKSHASIARYKQERPAAPLIVVLTGTDLYHDLPGSEETWQSLEWADRIVALNALAGRELRPHLAAKLKPIIQSARPVPHPRPPAQRHWTVFVLANLRAVKDPLRAAEASRLLPADSKIRVVHAGEAIESGFEGAAQLEIAANPRFRWLGPIDHGQARVDLSRSRLMAQTSLLEGGANAVSEALANSVPIVCSRIPGNLGILGEDYPATFESGNTQELAELMYRAEKDPVFYQLLKQRCRELAPLVAPSHETADWKSLLEELA